MYRLYAGEYCIFPYITVELLVREHIQLLTCYSHAALEQSCLFCNCHGGIFMVARYHDSFYGSRRTAAYSRFRLLTGRVCHTC